MVDNQGGAVMGQDIQRELIHADGFIDSMGNISAIPGCGMDKPVIGTLLF